MNAPARFTQDQFDEIYRLDVIDALENDHTIDFDDIKHPKYLQKGKCPKCGERTLYIARAQPYQLKCNRMNECQFEEKTRERYSYLFEKSRRWSNSTWSIVPAAGRVVWENVRFMTNW